MPVYILSLLEAGELNISCFFCAKLLSIMGHRHVLSCNVMLLPNTICSIYHFQISICAVRDDVMVKHEGHF